MFFVLTYRDTEVSHFVPSRVFEWLREGRGSNLSEVSGSRSLSDMALKVTVLLRLYAVPRRALHGSVLPGSTKRYFWHVVEQGFAYRGKASENKKLRAAQGQIRNT